MTDTSTANDGLRGFSASVCGTMGRFVKMNIVVPMVMLMAVIAYGRTANNSIYLPQTLNGVVEPASHNLRDCKNTSKREERAAICAISIDEEAYIQEFVDYHLGLGFDLIYIFDNSPNFDMEQWGKAKDCHVRVRHFPGNTKQMPAYAECAKTLEQEGSIDWVAFFDVDEFLIVKKHKNVIDFLKSYPSGGVAVNWRSFGTSGNKVYAPIPVTKRFVYRMADENGENQHTKSIIRLRDLDIEGLRTHPGSPHTFALLNGTKRVDTNGVEVPDALHPNGPVDEVALYHFRLKSQKEYIAKAKRGRSDVFLDENQIAQRAAENEAFIAAEDSFVFDDTAWQMMKKLVPKYACYD
jgi:Glycosyl transferase family 2